MRALRTAIDGAIAGVFFVGIVVLLLQVLP